MAFRDHLKTANFSFVDDDCTPDPSAGSACGFFQPGCKPLLETFRKHHTLFCEVLTYYLNISFGGIPCPFIPRIDELLNEDCGACIVIPTMGNLRQLIYRDGISYDQIKLPPQLINTTICVHPNKLKMMDFSNNYPLGPPDIDLVLQSPVTGFNNLKEVKFSGCGLTRPYYNLWASFPNVTHLDFSNNKLTLEKYDGEKYFVGSPTLRYLNLDGNAIRKTPQDTLRTMHALETLN